MPIPCSAEIEPPIAAMRSFTARVTAAEDCLSVRPVHPYRIHEGEVADCRRAPE
jgi:hypothetical protein